MLEHNTPAIVDKAEPSSNSANHGMAAEVHRLLAGDAKLRDELDAEVWFEHDSVARYVLDAQGRILHSNARGRALIASGAVGSGDMLFCAGHRNRAELDMLLARLSRAAETAGRIVFRAVDDAWCLLDLSVLPKMEDRIFATVCPARDWDAESITPLRTVFGLTRAETSVLSHLLCGEAPKEIARGMDTSIHTVRAHLRAICMRMGVRGINGALRLTFQLTASPNRMQAAPLAMPRAL